MFYKLIALSIVSIMVLSSCDKEDILRTKDDISNHNKKNKNNTIQVSGDFSTNQTTYPTRQWKSSISDCETPAVACYPDVVVTPDTQLETKIIKLDGHISNNTLTDYFDPVTGDYEELFPNFSGPAYEHLRDSVTVLEKVVNGDHVTYRTLWVDYSGRPDYGDDY